MLTPVILGIGLLLATAVIAYWSDNLGKKLGKKRVTIFGLRPRQTATIITIVSSWCIMLVTVLALLAVYAPLRNALLHYDRERAANLQLRSDKKMLDRSVAQLNRQQSTLKDEVTSSQLAASKARKALQRTAGSLKTARRGAQTARKAELNARRNETRARRAAATARRNQSEARRRETVARRNEALARRNAKVARAQFVSATTQLAQSSQRLRNVRLQLRHTKVLRQQAESGKRQAELLKQNAEASLKRVGREEVRVRIKLISAEKEAAAAEARVEKLNLKIKELETLQSELTETVSELRRVMVKSARTVEVAQLVSTGKRIIAFGVAFATRTIPAGQSASATRVSLRELLEEARATVSKTNDFTLALAPLVLPLPRVAEQAAAADREITDEQEILDVLSNYLQILNSTVSVRVIAARDHAEGETEIMAQMVPVAARQAFSRGAELARDKFEGVHSDAQIFSKLLAVIAEGRRFAERERAVEPPISRDSPNFFAPDTNEQIFEALGRIKTLQQKGGRISVRLVAADDLSTIEAPRVKFEVGSDT